MITTVLSRLFGVKGVLIFMANRDVKLAAAGAGVRMWQIADEMGMLDSSLSRKLRHELHDDEKAKIFAIIDKLAGGGQNAEAHSV